MARVANPYRPGFNQAPAELAGRQPVLAAAGEALDVAALDARTPRPLVLVGSRGVGKTVLLGEIAARAAETRSWLTVAIEVTPQRSFLPPLIERLQEAQALLEQAEPGRGLAVSELRLRAGAFGMGGEVAFKPRQRRRSEPPALPLEPALAAACRAALARDSGLVLAVDELQLAGREELGELAATLQQHVPDAWPLVVVVAGLPTIRESRRSVTYLERGEWHELGLLNHADSVRALAEPARTAGRPFARDAVDQLADAAGGYPYAIQVMGHHAWRASAGSEAITADHITQAVATAHQDLAAGLYAARWNDAAPREREYLRALAELTAAKHQVTGGDVAARLGQPTSAVSYLRDRLLKKGTLFTEGRYLRFPVPGMAAWIIAV
jgi:hypothetical protein